MARIAGIDLPRNNRGEIGLTYIYGIGRSSSRKILTNAGVDMNTKVGEWSDEQLNVIRKLITDEFRVE
ncbi:MAG: 30S ribosomal protein S13, partial [Bacteroidota bacterium]